MLSNRSCLGSSPSSDGVGSAAGTPETRLTPFSSTKSTNDKVAFLSDAPDVNATNTTSTHTHMSQNGASPVNRDPFITTGGRALSEQSVLSPTASAFHPFLVPISQAIDHASIGIDRESHLVPLHVAVHSVPAPSATIVTELVSPVSSYSPITTYSGTFSTDTSCITRALKVSGIYHPVQETMLQAGIQKMCRQIGGTLKFFRTDDNVLIRLSDIVDAVNIYNSLKANHPTWSVDFISPAVFAEKVTPNCPFASAHEGQVKLFASFLPNVSFDRTNLEVIVLDLLGIDGAIYAYQKQLATEAGAIRLIAEYSDVNAAANAVQRLNGTTVRGINISIAFHEPDLSLSPRHQGPPSTPTRVGPNQDELSQAMNRMAVSNHRMMSISTIPYGYTSVLSPTGRSFVPTAFAITPDITNIPATYGCQFSPSISSLIGFTPPGPQHNHVFQNSQFGASNSSQRGFMPQIGANGGHSLPRYNSKRPNSSQSGNRSSCANSSIGQHNVVDVDRIRAGLDVRTTIMLRNIPNKIDQGLLKSIVDQTSRGLYDFMYLRIDFANNCNVGYAFINFEDPYHIIGFVTARAGQRWNRYSSDKIAEVSYATIQGKDCLVQKFRNSSVMLEHPTFRPKIFFTGLHPRVGEEEDFPPPDNASKMRRSVENAEHVGLFAPRAGQHYRDEQRRRRSRYDRGTRLAALEEYDYEEYHSVEQGFPGPYAE